MNIKQDNIQTDKARLGAIGENNVVSILMQKGWDAFNANCTIKNYKSVDIVCLNSDMSENNDCPWKPKLALVQVKTCRQTAIPIGFSTRHCLDKEYLNRMVKGPYVFVLVNEESKEYDFRYFILSRLQFIELAYSVHHYYINGYKREKELKLDAPACLHVRWLEGKSDEATSKHIAFNNPLKGLSSENNWENIWKE
ncbi:MAG: hypothetical protein K2L56_06400 [Prevotella sp.]|nr:hypothetical protein [Prevotella sp.]